MNLQLSLIHNDINPFNWIVNNRIAVKGYIHIDNSYMAARDLYNYIAQNVTEDNFLEKVSQLNGFYSFIIEFENIIIAVSDLINSSPIFYHIDNSKITIGDNYQEFNAEQISLNQYSVEEYTISGYCYGNKTLFEGVFQLPPGTILIFNKHNKQLKFIAYYDYVPTFPLKRNENKKTVNELVDELHIIHRDIFSELITSLKGRRVILPLSGGYDSRLILEMLKELNYHNILCVTWGKKTDWQVRIAEKVAKDLNVEWVLIDSTRREWMSWYNTNFNNEMLYCGAIAAIPYIQENILIEKMRKVNLLKADDIFISGNSGDFIEGEHIPNVLGALTYENIVSIIKTKHQRLNKLIDNTRITSTIEEEINNFQQKFDLDLIYFFEYWEWKERQSKFVSNCVKPFENQGFEWRLPFWNKRLMNFWKDIDIEYKINRSLFYQYSEKYMNQNVTPANPEISLIKKYTERLSDPRYGCYNKISPINYISSNTSRLFKNMDFKYLKNQKLIHYKINSLVAMDIIDRLSQKYSFRGLETTPND